MMRRETHISGSGSGSLNSFASFRGSAESFGNDSNRSMDSTEYRDLLAFAMRLYYHVKQLYNMLEYYLETNSRYAYSNRYLAKQLEQLAVKMNQIWETVPINQQSITAYLYAIQIKVLQDQQKVKDAKINELQNEVDRLRAFILLYERRLIYAVSFDKAPGETMPVVRQKEQVTANVASYIGQGNQELIEYNIDNNNRNQFSWDGTQLEIDILLSSDETEDYKTPLLPHTNQPQSTIFRQEYEDTIENAQATSRPFNDRKETLETDGSEHIGYSRGVNSLQGSNELFFSGPFANDFQLGFPELIVSRDLDIEGII